MTKRVCVVVADAYLRLGYCGPVCPERVSIGDKLKWPNAYSWRRSLSREKRKAKSLLGAANSLAKRGSPPTIARTIRGAFNKLKKTREVFWSGRPDSNRRPPAPKARAETLSSWFV